MALYDVFNQAKPAEMGKLRDYQIKNFVMPKLHWDNFKCDTKLKWNKVQFGPTFVSKVPDGVSGVYTLVIDSGIAAHPTACCLLYVGKVKKQTFRQRFKQYLTERKRLRRTDRIKIAHSLNLWRDHVWFYYAPVTDLAKIPSIENKLITAFVPPLNEQFPAEIRDAVAIFRT